MRLDRSFPIESKRGARRSFQSVQRSLGSFSFEALFAAHCPHFLQLAPVLFQIFSVSPGIAVSHPGVDIVDPVSDPITVPRARREIVVVISGRIGRVRDGQSDSE